MADTQSDSVVIEVKADVGDAVENINRLQAANEELKARLKANRDELKKVADEMKNGGTEEQRKKYLALSEEIEKDTAALKANQSGINANRKAVSAYVAQSKDAEGSLNQLRKEASLMVAQWQAMSKAERESAEGKKLQQDLKEKQDAINEAMKSVGCFKDNIGRYTESINQSILGSSQFGRVLQGLGLDLSKIASGGMSAKEAFGQMGTGIRSAGMAAKSLALNPIFLILGGLATLISKIIESIHRSETATKAVEKAMASLRPVIDIINVTFDKLVGILVKGIEVLTDFAAKMFDAVAAQQQLVKDEQELEMMQRKYTAEITENEAKIAEARTESMNAEEHTAKERKAMMEEAIRLEKENSEKRVKLAEERLRLLKAEGDRSENDAAANRELAEAEAQVNAARKQAQTNLKMLNRQLNTVNKSIAAEQAANTKAAKAVREKAEADKAAAAAARQKAIAELNASTLETQTENQRKINDLQKEGTALYAEELRARGQLDADAAQEQILTYFDLCDQRAQIDTAESERRRQKAQEEIEQSIADEDTKQAALLEVEEKYRLEREEIKRTQDEAASAFADQLREQQETDEQEKLDKAEQDAADKDAADEAEAQRLANQHSRLKDLWKDYYVKKKKFGEDDQKTQKSLLKLQLSAAQEVFSQMGGTLMQFQGVNKAAFEAGKAISIATTIIDTLQGAQEAFNAYASIPIVGPALGIAAAATALASGFLRVKQIKETKYDSGETSASADSGGTMPDGNAAVAQSKSAQAQATSEKAEIAPTGTTYYEYGSLESGANESAGAVLNNQPQAASGITREEMVEAIAAQPAPVVSVEEITDTQATVRAREDRNTYA